MDDKVITKKIKVHVKAYIRSEVKIKGVGQSIRATSVPSVEGKNDNSDDDRVEFYTEGILKIKGDTVEISYKENQELGMAGIESLLRFKKSKPEFVNLLRKGPSQTSLVFNTSVKRCICTYSIGGMSFDICICTNKVENIFEETHGKILLDYGIEMYGSSTEQNIYIIEYKEYGA